MAQPVRLTTIDHDDAMDDVADAVKAILQSNTGVDIGDVDILSIAAGTNVIGKVRLVSTDGSEVTLDSQNAVSTVEKASIVHLEKPFGKGNLTSDGVQLSAEVTTSNDTWTTVESITVEPPATGAGNIVEVEFGLTYQIKSSSTTKHVKHKAQARDKDGTWIDLYTEITRSADASVYLEVTYSGRFETVTNFDAVPFDVQVMIKRQDSGENALAQVKNSSYVKVIYNAD